jgi:hypothetical protein
MAPQFTAVSATADPVEVKDAAVPRPIADKRIKIAFLNIGTAGLLSTDR